MASPKRIYDVVVWGSSGFTGRLVSQYLSRVASNLSAPAVPSPASPYASPLRWAMAGRDLPKITALRDTIITDKKSSPDVLSADPTNISSLCDLVGQTKVIISCAGPFITCGSPLVEACIKMGTDYVDITGETPFVRQIMDRFGADAGKSSSMIVPMCGFDSIPSDLGTYFTVTQMRKRFDVKGIRSVKSYMLMNGTLSGGTLATGMTLEKMGPAIVAQMKDPFLLGGVPAGGVRPEDADVAAPGFCSELGAHTGPFMMAGINTRVVRRSAKELNYGENFGYTEVQLCRDEAEAKKLARGLPPVQKREEMVKAGYLPKQGEGPSEEVRAKSFFKFHLIGEADNGQKLATIVSGGDPGYTETSKMVSEAAIMLAREKGALPPRGILTPALAFGDRLIARLHERGLKFEVDEDLTAKLNGGKAKL